jgi:hypothetical protein
VVKSVLTPCETVVEHHCFRGSLCLHLQGVGIKWLGEEVGQLCRWVFKEYGHSESKWGERVELGPSKFGSLLLYNMRTQKTSV